MRINELQNQRREEARVLQEDRCAGDAASQAIRHQNAQEQEIALNEESALTATSQDIWRKIVLIAPALFAISKVITQEIVQTAEREESATTAISQAIWPETVRSQEDTDKKATQARETG